MNGRNAVRAPSRFQFLEVSTVARCFIYEQVVALAILLAFQSPILRAEVQTVADLTSLETIVNTARTNDTLAKITPPGPETYGNSLGAIAYTPDFDTNFLAGLVTQTNDGFAVSSVIVLESNTTPRVRAYLNSTGSIVHTASPPTNYNPAAWVESVYGECPAWLDQSGEDQWYANRDPARQIISLSLISTSDVPVYLAFLTNSVPQGTKDGTNYQSLLILYSNDIAFVNMTKTDSGALLYIHAPSSVDAVDLFRTTNIVDSSSWTLPATLDHTTDPMTWSYAWAGTLDHFFCGNAGVDTDGDGLADIRETWLHGTSPLLADSDGDGLSDGLEIMNYGLNPLNSDSDGDGIGDAEEVSGGTNPGNADSDGDGLTDYAEIYTYFGHVDPMNADSDDDGLNDYAELVTHNSYAAPECGGAQDSDRDGLDDYAEIVTYGTNPRLVDTDGDGIDDEYEVHYGLNPTNAADAILDADGDGFNNLTEYQWDYQPVTSNATPPTTQRCILCPGGSNTVQECYYRTTDYWNILAMGDMGNNSARIRVRPFYNSGALAEQALYHTQSPGFTINGTAASSVPSPIIVPASSTSIEYRIISDTTARGTNLYFRLTNTNEPTATKDSARFFFPEIEEVNFWGPGSSPNYVDVDYGQTNTLWIRMPDNTNNCRVRMKPQQGPNNWYGIGYFHWTDRMLVKVTGTGACPETTTLNALDWQSAYGLWNISPTTRGILLDCGSYTFQVGFDMNADGTLDEGEVQETCRVHVPIVDINGDYNRDGNSTDDPGETNEVTFAGTNGFVILVNADDDDGDGEPDCEKNGDPLHYYINGSNDLSDIYVLRCPKLGIPTNEMPDDLKVTISVLEPGTEAISDNAVVYPVRQAGQQGYTSFQLSADSTRLLFGGTGTAEVGIEGRKFGEEVVVRMQLKKGTTVLGSDEVRVLLAPFFVLSNCDDTTKVYSGAGPGPAEWPILYTELTNALNGIVDVEKLGGAVFIQDDGEIGYTRLPSGMSTEKPAAVMDRGDPAFENMISSNTCYFYFGGGHGGSIEAAPPTAAQPYGSIIVGSTNLAATEAFLLKQAVQSVSNSLITLPTEWLAVGHADEVFTIVPTASGFSVLVADLELAIELLEDNPDEETWGDFMSRSNILAHYEANTAKVAFVEARLAAVRASLSEGLGISESQFIKVPVAFSVHDWNLSVPRAEAVLPNSVNMLVVKNTSGTRRLVLPDPFFDPFLEDLAPKLTAIGYVAGTEIRAICTTEPHSRAGEVHCATISSRVAP